MRRAAALGALLVVASLPGAARADDAGVVAAYRSHVPAVKRAVAAYVKAGRRADRTGSRRDLRAVIAADRDINTAIDTLVAAVRAEQPSTDTGERAQRCTIRRHRLWRKANLLEMASIRADLRHERARSDALWRRAVRTINRSYRAEKCRRRAFAAIARAG